MIYLDTNIAIYVINRRVPAIRHRLAEQLRLGTEIGLPAISVRTALRPCAQRQAAQARRRGATLVTANGREFARVPGLMVTDWVT